MRVNISRTSSAAAASLGAPSRCVPLARAAVSGMPRTSAVPNEFVGPSMGVAVEKMRSEAHNALYSFHGNLLVGARKADAWRENEAQISAAGFLIRAHGRHQGFGRNAGPRRERSNVADQRDNAGYVIGAGHTGFMTKQCSGHESPGHGFSMLVASIVGNAFQRVGEGMAKVEDLTEPGFVLVAADHSGFDAYVARNQKVQGRTISAQHPGYVLLQIREEGRVSNDPVLDH